MSNCDNPNDPDHQLICPKLSNPSATCKMCEAWQEADRFWRRWFKGGILTAFWRTWTEERRLPMSDEQSSGGAAEGKSPSGRYNSPFERDYIFWMKVSVVVGIGGIICLVISIFIATTRAEMHQAKYVSVVTWMLELDKLYLANPHIMKYFEEDEPISKDSTDYPLAVAAAEFMLDLMDSMLDAYKEKWPDESWRNWAEEIFSKSQILRSYLENKRTWYCKHLYPKYLEWSKKEGNPRAPEQKPCK